MNRPFWVTLTVAATFAVSAHAQAQTIKAKGPALAGVCAGSLELAAKMTATSRNPNPAVIQNMQIARDFYADMPKFDTNEVSQNAEAFIKLMSGRMAAAQTPAEGVRVKKEVFAIAQNCFVTARKNGAPIPTAQAQPAPQPGTTQPLAAQPGIVQPAQPLETQPMILQPDPQPLQVQPLETQPLILDAQ